MRKTNRVLSLLLSAALLAAFVPAVTMPAEAAAIASITVNGPALASTGDRITGGVTNTGLQFRSSGDERAVTMAQYGPAGDRRFAVRGGEHPTGGHDFLQVFITDAAIRALSSVTLELTYLNNGGGFDGQYTSASGTHTGTGQFPRDNSGTWRTHSIRLNSCNFNGATQGHGNHIRFGGGPVIHSIRLIEVTLPDAPSVHAANEALTWNAIRNQNTLQMNVQTNLTLSTTGQMNTSIAWTSSNTAVIAANGTVSRLQNDTYVTLTAVISRGSVSATRRFYIGVRGTGTGTDANAVAAMRDTLTWDYIRNGNAAQNRVTTNLFLPAIGHNGTNISWASTGSARISTAGVVSMADNAATVTLTATVSRGSQSGTVTFALTVLARYDFTNQIRPSIGNEAQFPTKDYIASDFNARAYGARTSAESPGFCNREAFQTAINAARDAGGGVVYAPAGIYEFHSEVLGIEQDQGITHSYNYVLDLRESVQLRGDWTDPDKNGGAVQGTVFAVYAGHNSPNYSRYEAMGRTESQTGHQMLTNVSDRFIQMERGTGVTNLSIWHPNQTLSGTNAVKYPWTLFQRSGDSATIEHVTLVNSYNGFHSAPSELHYVLNSRITAFNTGIRVHVCTDIGRIEGVSIADYWSRSGLPGSPSASAVTAATRANATGFAMHRSDWEYVANLKVTGYKIGMWVGREYYKNSAGQDVLAGYTPNAQFYGLALQNCETAIFIDDVNGFGLLISDSVFSGDRAAYFDTPFNTSVQFNGVDFTGPIVSDSTGSDGVLSFENCTFSGYGTNAVRINGRTNLLIAQSRFTSGGNHVSKQNNSTVKSINSGSNGTLTVAGNTTNVTQTRSDAYTFEPMPRGVKTDIDVHPKARADNILRVDLPRATGINGNSPSTDVTAQLQNALNAVSSAGGGIVHLPGGRYLVSNPITVPSGVELRGTWDVQHHTEGGGSAIFTAYMGSGGGAGRSLIELNENAGIRGLNVTQTNITNQSSFNNNSPFLIQGRGKGVYAVNITVPVGYRGIDLYTHDTSGHYVDYFGGTLLHAGIWVGGGANGGFIRNMQFNPHYAMRRPSGGQGYQSISGDLYAFTQGNCSALMFADVNNQTIFNNFVFGSVYGIHFKRDSNGKYPGRITMIGHGSDGCTYALYVESGGADTKIVAINSELVNTNIASQPERAYVRMGASASADIHPQTEMILYNSAFWGSPTTGPIINAGTLRFQQANFHQMNGDRTGMNINGGRVHVLNSYFAYWRAGAGTAAGGHFFTMGAGADSAEFTNNYYRYAPGTGTLPANRYSVSGSTNRLYGTDIAGGTRLFTLTGVTEGVHTFHDSTPLSVTLRNTGTSALSNVQVTVTGNGFALGGTTASASVAANGTINFTVAPITGLTGNHYATVVISIGGIRAGIFYISFIPPNYGHVRGASVITAADVTMLRAYIASQNKQDFIDGNPGFNSANADVNADGFINSADVTLLRRWLAAADKSTVPLGPGP
jgi:hypothetical protein